MTEEIIIDGVNVWSCKHYDLENNYCDQSYLGEGGLLKNTKNPKRCECSPNCYYKQLKCLEQENKELKSQRDEARIAYNDLILDIVSDIPFEGEIGGERFISIKDRLHQMQKALASLEEIREIAENAKEGRYATKSEDYTEGMRIIGCYVLNKINEVLK